MTVRVHTARVAYRGADRLDVSRQGNDALGVTFAPSWDLLRPIIEARRAGEDDGPLWPAYVEGYRVEMRAAYRQRRRDWRRVLAMPEVTLCCFCADPARCHRTLLAEMFGKLGAAVCGERQKESGHGDG